MNEEKYRLTVARVLLEMKQDMLALADRANMQNAKIEALGCLVFVLLQRAEHDPLLASSLRAQFEKMEANLLASEASDEFMKIRRETWEMKLPAALRAAVFPPNP